MNRLWLQPIVAIFAFVGLVAGAGVGLLIPLSTTYQAKAQVALVPGTDLTTAEASAYWEVLDQNQVPRTAATVFNDERWLPSAVAAAGVDAGALTLTAGAIPDTTLVSITADGPSARSVQAAVSDLLDKATPEVSAVSAPFQVRVVSQPDHATATTTPRLQPVLAGALAGLLLGAVIGLGFGWLRTRGQGGTARRTDKVTAAS